jgi:hypothetical protein
MLNCGSKPLWKAPPITSVSYFHHQSMDSSTRESTSLEVSIVVLFINLITPEKAAVSLSKQSLTKMHCGCVQGSIAEQEKG